MFEQSPIRIVHMCVCVCVSLCTTVIHMEHARNSSSNTSIAQMSTT